MKEAKFISQWLRPLLLLLVPVVALFAYAIATKEWAVLLGLVPTAGALFVAPPTAGSGGFSRIGALLIALVVGAVLLTSCAGGGLREDAKPWVAPVVSMCVPACDVAKVEAAQAVALIDDELGRIVAHIAAEQAYQWCRFGCIMAEHAVEPAGN